MFYRWFTDPERAPPLPAGGPRAPLAPLRRRACARRRPRAGDAEARELVDALRRAATSSRACWDEHEVGAARTRRQARRPPGGRRDRARLPDPHRREPAGAARRLHRQPGTEAAERLALLAGRRHAVLERAAEQPAEPGQARPATIEVDEVACVRPSRSRTSCRRRGSRCRAIISAVALTPAPASRPGRERAAEVDHERAARRQARGRRGSARRPRASPSTVMAIQVITRASAPAARRARRPRGRWPRSPPDTARRGRRARRRRAGRACTWKVENVVNAPQKPVPMQRAPEAPGDRRDERAQQQRPGDVGGEGRPRPVPGVIGSASASPARASVPAAPPT